MTARRKAIVIGCGRIGAGLKPSAERTDTHAGALSVSPNFEVTLFDEHRDIARAASQAYGAAALEDFTLEALSTFSLAVISSPTATHFEYLKLLISAGIPVIICEKPVSSDLNQLEEISVLRDKGSSRVLVNYTRRFQPAYLKLQSHVSCLIGKQKLTGCAIRYQRGFLNNASHAIDLLQFLLGWNISEAAVEISLKVADEIAEDPTISCAGEWNGAVFSVVGLPHVSFSLFEIDLFFESDAVRVRDRGNTIEMATSDRPGDYYSPLRTVSVQSECMEDPFGNLYRYVETIFASDSALDNFKSSVAMTNWMISILERAR